jgi:RNA polymerase sigma-70 factor (ECF subfamily)
MLYNLARKLCRSPQDADDVVQQTYVHALQAWTRQRPERVGPWMATICLNVVRSEYRRRQARPVEILDPFAGSTVGSPDDTAEGAVARVDRAAIDGALRQLPAAQREAVTLMDLCRFTAAEVAEITGVPRATVLSRVHRGHKRLAGLLDGEVINDG